MKNATAIYLSLAVITASVIAWFIYNGSLLKSGVTNDFARDDESIYNTLRSELIAGGVYFGWFDDAVSKAYAAGANINGKASKTAAFMQVFSLNSGDKMYSGKKARFNAIYNNLINRYK